MTIFPGSIYGSMGRLGVGKQTSAAAAWWLSGGISAANCIAAYQPKGAASFDASLVNVANPGTLNITQYISPTWDASAGWTGGGGSYLLVPYVGINQNTTMIARYTSPVTSGCVFAGQTNSPNTYFNFLPHNSMWNTTSWNPYTEIKDGIGGFVGNKVYVNKNIVAAFTDATWSLDSRVAILNRWRKTALSEWGYSGTVAAVAIYNIRLSTDQLNGLTDAMAAL